MNDYKATEKRRDVSDLSSATVGTVAVTPRGPAARAGLCPFREHVSFILTTIVCWSRLFVLLRLMLLIRSSLVSYYVPLTCSVLTANVNNIVLIRSRETC